MPSTTEGAGRSGEENPLGLTRLEVASGMVLGRGTGQSLPPAPTGGPVDALRNLVRPLLAQPPCVLAFSGGRDSSALLALLVDVARQDGLDQPLAVTARWDGDEASNESSWQEEVVRAIGAVHWEIVRPGTDLDLLGAEATSVLERTGLLWPAPSYAFLPMMRLAAGGTFLSGEGGDEAFGLYPLGRLWSSVRGHRVPRSSDLRALALCCLPRPLRRRRWQHNDPPYQSWLRADAFALVAHDLADEMADDPLRFDRYLAISRQRRSADLTLESLGSVAALEGARYVAPLLDQGFLASLAAWGGPFGRGDRTGVMEALFANLLPGQILSRTSKATFGGVFWGPEARRFAQQWDGTGLDPGLVDAEALRREWLADVPVHAATLPLHAAWLYDRNRR